MTKKQILDRLDNIISDLDCEFDEEAYEKIDQLREDLRCDLALQPEVRP